MSAHPINMLSVLVHIKYKKTCEKYCKTLRNINSKIQLPDKIMHTDIHNMITHKLMFFLMHHSNIHFRIYYVTFLD